MTKKEYELELTRLQFLNSQLRNKNKKLLEKIRDKDRKILSLTTTNKNLQEKVEKMTGYITFPS